MSRAVQYFSDEYLERCREMTSSQIVEYLEGFRALQSAIPIPARSTLISIKMPEDLLAGFRRRSELEGVPYQTMIKILMRIWLRES